MRRRVSTYGFCLLMLAAAAPALAQRTTGTIIGTVTDESGAVLPGVTVTLTGAGVAGSPTSITSETGTYRFTSLPPGEYNLTFVLQGFATVNRERVVLPLAETVEIPIQMKVSTLQETVTVTGDSPVVNTASAEVSTNFNREWVESAPQRRFTFFDLINQAAGVSPATSTSSRSSAFGSSTTENSYQLDGTDFTAPSTGAAWPWPNTDAIEEVQVLSLGASAEYGNVQGAVFNVVTRQGSNEFHGDGNLYFQHQSLTGRNTDRRAGRRAAVPPRRVQGHDLAAWRADQEGQALVLRLVPVPEGLRVAARHARGISGAVVGEARLRQAELPVDREQQGSVPVPRRLLPDSGPRDRGDGAVARSASRMATTRRRA